MGAGYRVIGIRQYNYAFHIVNPSFESGIYFNNHNPQQKTDST